MKITEIPFECDNFFIGGDFKSANNYVIVNDRSQIFRNGKLLKIDSDLNFKNLAVSIISDHQFLLVEREISTKESKDEIPNSYLINDKGEIENIFYLGSVMNIISTKENIICSYSDAQLDTQKYDGKGFKYGTNGLVVFDLNGNSVFEYYRDEEKSKWLNFIYNYAFHEGNYEIVYFLPYTNWKIIEFSLKDFSSKVICSLPESEKIINTFWNPFGFSKKGEDWFFITPDYENWCSRIFKMNSKKEIEEIGRCCFSTSPKSIKGGKFFVPFSGGDGKKSNCQLIET